MLGEIRLNLTEPRAHEQFGHALWVVVLLILKDLTGDHLLLHLFKQIDDSKNEDGSKKPYSPVTKMRHFSPDVSTQD